MLNYHDENIDICTMRIITIFRLNFNISLFHLPIFHLPLESFVFEGIDFDHNTSFLFQKTISTKTISNQLFFDSTIHKVNFAKTPITYNNNIFKS